MIRRLLSLIYGIVGCWVLLVLAGRFVFGITPSQLIMGAGDGQQGFWLAIAAVGLCLLAMVLLFSRLPLIRRAWANVGAMLLCTVLLLWAMVLFGAGAIAI